MATLLQLRSAVSALIVSAGATGALQLNANTRERAFEAYVFSLLIRAVQQAGGTATVVGIKSGANPNPIVFRGGPGRLGSTTQDFAYAKCSLNGKSFEIHVDVEFQGSSGAVHEIDISAVDAAHAADVRASPASLPTARHLRAAVECKFYDSTLGVALGRVFVGLVSDCGTLKASAFLTNGTHKGLALFLTAKPNLSTAFGVTPLAPAVETRVVAIFEQDFRMWAGVP
jgi:hypothetical protein